MINVICTVTEIKDETYGAYYDPLANSRNRDGTPRKLYRVKTKEGFSFALNETQVLGIGIGQKIRYQVTLIGAAEASELDEAYEVISDLVAKAKRSAEEWAKTKEGQQGTAGDPSHHTGCPGLGDAQVSDHSTTLLVLTGAESLLIRKALGSGGLADVKDFVEALTAYNRGVIRGTERVKAEAQAAKSCTKPPSRG